MDRFEIARVGSWIISNTLPEAAIAFQMPDQWLTQASKVVVLLQPLVQTRKLFILADTSFGSCCVDEVAASHVKCAAIVHFGPACVSRTTRIPVLHIFGQEELDLSHFVDELERFDPQNAVFIGFDLSFLYLREKLVQEIEKRSVLQNVKIVIQEECSEVKHGESIISGPMMFDFPKAELNADCSFVFLRSREYNEENESPLLNNLVLENMHCKHYIYDIAGSKKISEKSFASMKWLMRRFYLVERVKDAEIIGIVAGTLTVEGYLDVISRMKKLIKSAGKKYYLLLIGKVNEAKLANFQEIDIFVNISCPFSSMLDTQGFVKEMVTPLEVELALNPDKEWSGHYTTSFGDVLQCPLSANLDESAREQSPRYSLARRCVVGRSKPDYEEGAGDEAVENLALMKVNDSKLIPQDDASGLVMQSRVQAREYNGLNPAIGETPVERAEMGLSGIARNYKSKN